MRPTLSISLLVLISACASGPRLYDGFAGYDRKVDTDDPVAQQWFDQGIQLVYGFNHDEAIRSFAEAAKIDPDCAMAWWGQSYAHGIHVNNPEMSEEQSRLGYEAAQEAIARRDHADPVGQALIDAVSVRYAWPIPADRKPLDESYAAAMERAWRRFPNDVDVGTLFAESLMNLQPWDYWAKDGSPKGRIEEVLATLERVIELEPNHPGANHLYIHAVEASDEPERGIASADRLRDLVPGSGHLVHMPSHIYARVGRWAEAADTNERAIKADRDYFAIAPEPAFYSLYFVHNIHFLSWAAMMEGRYEVAMDAANELVEGIPPNFINDLTFIADGFMSTPLHVNIRFGRWHDILDAKKPPAWRKMSLAMWHYARGVALSALGRVDEARREIDAFETAAAVVPEDWVVGNNPCADVLAVARQMLFGELAYRERRFDEAFTALHKGVELEDDLVYDEPPGWMQPVRHALGALLMGVGRAQEAEQAYREDLEKYPNNGWALLGLSRALTAQGRVSEAGQVDSQRDSVWTRADVTPSSSCYCEPGGE